MDEFLLDTSVFYRAGSDRKKAALRDTGAMLKTAPTCVLEILSGMGKAKSFQNRQRALKSFYELCGGEGLLRPDSDVVVERAFGMKPSQPLDYGVLWAAIHEALRAPDADTLRSKVDTKFLTEWDDEQGSGFKRPMDDAYRVVDPELSAAVRARGWEDKATKRIAVELEAERARTETGRDFALIGMAGRAGLLSSELLDSVLVEHEVDASHEAIRLAKEAYDGSLDPYLAVYIEYHARSARSRRTVGQNDGLDLDPLVYLRPDDPSQRYLSAEKLWVELVDKALPGRSVNVDVLFSASGV